MAGHLNLRQFKCDKCDKAFNTKAKLKIHSVAHSNVFAFNCRVCERKYKFKSNLRRHNRTVHSNNKFCLIVCKKIH
jgi:KRAB domain-containing zinc finger protein